MKSGNSGHSTGAHLHFEVRKSPYDYNTRVNPTKLYANYYINEYNYNINIWAE